MVDICFLTFSTNFRHIPSVVAPFEAYTNKIKNIDKLGI